MNQDERETNCVKECMRRKETEGGREGERTTMRRRRRKRGSLGGGERRTPHLDRAAVWCVGRSLLEHSHFHALRRMEYGIVGIFAS